MEIQGKVALITGASRGIGRAIALELAQVGIKRLILVARDRQKLVEVANEIEAMGTQTAIVPLDLTQTIEVNIAVAQLWRNFGQIHLLVNCAGVAYQSSFLQSKMPQVQEELSVNLLGMYNLTSLIARRMVSQRQGTIVNVSSLMGKVAAPTMATYSATKFAILGFTQALRQELAEHNIRVIALLPTLTDTDMVRDLKLFRWVIPMTPQEVAKALVTGMQNDSPEILVGWQSHLAVLCQRLAPWLLELILRIATPPAPRKQQPAERLNKLIPKLNFLTRIHRFGDLFLSRT
ncbi:SDR family NAD(P)-dependent oxidoreductase [Nostoc sp. UCD121]|uniref:SDR family NAD(P)-dependent oxidoreductase n=1 Tax=unclassified Nostoc TaxID=2593658 RepID=UPI00162978DE|nr:MULTISPECIES: SDR family NAD(P)-dependent oxidoreductase [unclassified Nostoc]MBC1219491.1 SDR family NAD(P)-dependent oxidoreductase [Nostoc sp. UCD120]MBC1275346.1 SDR family NAD(P)-dependent oxidoreductase [Nostoc sp. UCD121]MBC1296220.1 SDR family NAD(P)-dependent oxidoreductase [Nostoc sp. UCD122]